MLIGVIFSTSFCSCAENTPKDEQSAQALTDTKKNTKDLTSNSSSQIKNVYENGKNEEPTEPLTAEETLIIEIVKDYITSIERFDIDAIAKLYDPAVLSDSKVYESLKKIRDDACSSGVASDDYEEIWKLTEEYEDLKFTFNDYATCEIIGNLAHVSIEYLADFCDRGYQVQYAVTFGFAMTRINDEWYIKDDPNHENSSNTYGADDFDSPSVPIDIAYYSAEDINLIINKCYSDIQNNKLEKYNVESAELITIADVIKVYGELNSFLTIEAHENSYSPYWYKTGGYSVFLDSNGNDIIRMGEVSYSNDEVIPLTENNNPSNSVYVVDLFK